MFTAYILLSLWLWYSAAINTYINLDRQFPFIIRIIFHIHLGIYI